MAKDGEKPKIIRWKGILAQNDRKTRLLVFAIIAITSAALTFTQLGFLGIGLSDQYTTYVIILLMPIALCALLLGTAWGLVLGLFSGGILLLHAKVLPLDAYELAFVTPFSSIVMLGIAGALLGILFAFALRNNPSKTRRIIYISIVCAIVSALYTAGFVINAFIAMLADLSTSFAANLPDNELISVAQSETITMMERLGDISSQVILDALLMATICILGDFSAKAIMKRAENPGLRELFGIKFFVVVYFAFMATSIVGFVFITQVELNSAFDDLKDEVDYLNAQLRDADNRTDVLLSTLKSLGVDTTDLDDDDVSRLYNSITTHKFLTGYDPDSDGLVFMAFGNDFESCEILTSNDEKVFPPSGGQLNREMFTAMTKSADSGEMQRIVYDSNGTLINVEGLDDHSPKLEIAYLYAQREGDTTTGMIRPSSLVFVGRMPVMGWTTLGVFVVLLAVFSLTFNLLSNVVIRRIDETNSVMARIGEGDLDARVEIRDSRELSSLSDGINETVSKLKGWISEAETRMDAELATAKAIQAAALPSTFPPYPDIARFDIYATMNAAREVGGDFYDFFLVGDNCGPDAGKLGFVIADVSGKGVPAALFMMKAKAQIRDYMTSGMELGEAIENANRQLCDGNAAGMFVTVWVGVLDYASGHVDFVNAGHNPPLLWQREGGWRWLTEKSGLPLGLFDGMPYKAHSIECEIGDQFLLYTDGITEAMNTEDELYGEERLIALAQKNYSLHPRELLRELRFDVAKYSLGAQQSDDITTLALEVGVPPELTATLIVPADTKELPRVNDFIHAELDRRLCPLRAQKQLDIAVEELFVNVANYAYPDATPENPGLARISYSYSADPPSVRVDIADSGIPYNPLAKPDAVTPDDIMEVPIGGLGILMAKRSVDEMDYERVDGNNVVTIVKRW